MNRLRIRPVAALAAALGIALTFSLGTWQSRRADAKLILQEHLETSMAAPAQPFDDRAFDAATWNWRHVTLHGRWIPDDVVYLDNRPQDGRAGFYVIMPFALGDGAVVIINRGWFARDPQDRTRIATYTTPVGTVDVAGVIWHDEKRLLELGGSQEGRLGGIWQNFDFDQFALVSGTRPLHFVLRQDRAVSDGLDRSWPDQGAALQAQIDRHHGYMIQWYGLAATILVLTLFYGFRKARNDNI